MEVKNLYWCFVIVVITLNSEIVIAATDSCANDLTVTNNAISELNNAMYKMKSGIKSLQNQVLSQEEMSRQAAALHAEELKRMSALKTDLEDLQDKQEIQLVNYDVLSAPTVDFNSLSSYSKLKRAEVEAVRTYLVDNLWKGQLLTRSIEESTDIFRQSQAWMNDIVTNLKTQQVSCTSQLTKETAILNRTNYEYRILQNEIAIDQTRSDTLTSEIDALTAQLTARLGRCIPDSLYYHVVSNSDVVVDSVAFVSERCDTYTAGAMSDCVNEQNENRLKHLELAVTLENKTRTDDAMNCYLSKAEIDFAKCKADFSNCEHLLEKKKEIIENPHPQMHEKTTHAIQLYHDVMEIRLDRTVPLEKKVKEIGDKLVQELETVTVDHLTDWSYDLYYHAMEEYVNQATKWLCSYHRSPCNAGELCGLKHFTDMQPNVEEFVNSLSTLKKMFHDVTMAGDIIPYGTIQPAKAYNYLLKAQLMLSKDHFLNDKIWNNMTEDMLRMTVADIYTEKRDEGVLTKNIAWLVSNEVYSWLSLTPQMRFFIAKVNELLSIVIRDRDAVSSLVECVCISSDCDGKDILYV